jgi:hypothetical protein
VVPEPGDGARQAPGLLLPLMLLLGALLAAGSVLTEFRPSAGLAPEAAARVEDKTVTRAQLELAVATVAADRRATGRETLDDLRAHVLARLVDEELLVAHAIDIGLAAADATARKALIRAMIDSVVADHADRQADEEELAALFARERERFTRVTGLRLERLHVQAPAAAEATDEARRAARERARRARAALLAGESFSAVRARLGDEPAFPLPPGWIEPSTLATYTGPTLAETAVSIPLDRPSEVLETPGGFDVLVVRERRTTAPATWREARDELEELWKRQRDEEALNRYLTDLRRRARIAVAPDLRLGAAP